LDGGRRVTFAGWGVNVPPARAADRSLWATLDRPHASFCVPIEKAADTDARCPPHLPTSGGRRRGKKGRLQSVRGSGTRRGGKAATVGDDMESPEFGRTEEGERRTESVQGTPQPPRTSYWRHKRRRTGADERDVRGSSDLVAVVESVLAALARHPRAAALVCDHDPLLTDLCDRTRVPVAIGFGRQQVSLATLPSVYAAETDVVRCILWRWVAAFSATSAGDTPALTNPYSPSVCVSAGRGEGAECPNARRWDDRVVGGWPSPLAMMPYAEAPRNDLLLWASLSVPALGSAPDAVKDMLDAAAIVGAVAKGDPTVSAEDALHADAGLCRGGRLFATMDSADALGRWGLPEYVAVDDLPGGGAVTSYGEAVSVDDASSQTGEPIVSFTALVSKYPTGPGAFSSPSARWVTRLPGPPLGEQALRSAGALDHLQAAVDRGVDGTVAQRLYGVLSSDDFADFAFRVVNDTVRRLSEPSVEAGGEGDVPEACLAAPAWPSSVLPLDVYATYAIGNGEDGPPSVVLWVRVVFDRALVNPEERDWWASA